MNRTKSVREDVGEGVDRPRPPPGVVKVSDLAPVGLGQVPCRCVEVDGPPAVTADFVILRRQKASEDDDRAVEPYRPDLGQEPDDVKRVFGPPAAEVVLERVELGGSCRSLPFGRTPAADGVSREPGEPGDSADRVPMPIEIADVHHQNHPDHGDPAREGKGGDRGPGMRRRDHETVARDVPSSPRPPSGWVIVLAMG